MSAEPVVAEVSSVQNKPQPASGAAGLPTDRPPPAPVVSVLIKALNEEKNIAAAIEHALAAVSRVGGEVVLADSCSSDGTAAIASRYPIRVVQLAHPEERCCGIGPQLGYQNAGGEFVYLLDGDMRMRPDFLREAVDFMRLHPRAGAVGGQIVELNRDNLEYQARADRDMDHLKAGQVDRLDGGGLYRRAAIEQIGYLSNRNLHSYEEFELGIRIRHAGWELWRIGSPAVEHRGHEISAYALLGRRWRSRYAFGIGEVTRAALGQPHARLLWRELRELKQYLVLLVYWVFIGALTLAGILPWPALIVAAGLPLAAAVVQKRSWRKGLYSCVSWHLHIVALVRGFLAKRVDPRERIDDVVLSDRSKAGGKA